MFLCGLEDGEGRDELKTKETLAHWATLSEQVAWQVIELPLGSRV